MLHSGACERTFNDSSRKYMTNFVLTTADREDERLKQHLLPVGAREHRLASPEAAFRTLDQDRNGSRRENVVSSGNVS